jgi:signal transduction histidine kinase/ligand-binding sensor domain-containing protein
MPPWRARHALIGASVVLLGAAARAQAPAQRPEATLAQLAHRAWTARDGAPVGIQTLAQTRDGFLWLGGPTGLFRFDGARFERYEPPPGQATPSNLVGVLHAVPDGTLWVGYMAAGGVSAITAGRLVNYGARDGLPGGTVNAFARDSAGTVWASTTRGLARLIGGRWRVVGPEVGYPGGFTNDPTVDRRGALWVDASTGVYVLPRGARRFTWRAPPLAVGEGEVGSGSVRATPGGAVWTVSMSRGLSQLTDTAGRPLPAAPYYDRDRGGERGWWGMVVDRRAHAWGTYTRGRLVRVTLGDGARVPGGAATWDTLGFSPRAGTSGRVVGAVLEDREGSIWVTTDGGVDQFRAPKVMAIGLPRPDDPPPIAAADAGALWAGSYSGRLALVGDRGRMREAPPTGITAAQRDLDDEVWVGGLSGLWQARGGRFTRVALPPELRQNILLAIARARDGTLWVSGQRRGTFRRRGAAWYRYGAPDTYANAIAADSAGRVWLGYGDGRLVREGDGPTRVYGATEGLRVGQVLTVAIQGRRVWVGGDLGVAVLDAPAPRGTDGGDGRQEPARVSPLITTDGPLRTVTGIVETADAVWLRDADGVVRVPAADVARALRDPGHRVRAERFDARDRVDGPALYLAPTAIRGTDGRLWVTWMGGVGWIDPAHVRRNPVPPPVQVRGLAAAGRTYPTARGVTLPSRTRALSVAYTALSLAVPERVRFRYRLVGLDTTWQDAGPRREAFYTNLGPGPYRFEVTAANDDGVWSVAPAALDFLVPPAFVETEAFRALCAVAAGGTLWLLVLWRQRRIAGVIRARFEATLAERTRVARELHDTLLTDVAGIRMQLDAVARTVGPAGIGAAIADIRDQASQALVNARRAVVDMRTAADGAHPVDDQLAEAARRIFADTGVVARVSHTGTPRRYPPDVEAEALRIGTEALTNARKHAACRTVRVTCAYRRRSLRLEVRDDGRGFDPARAAANGHFGLVGLRERAAAVGARLTIDSAPGRGTAILVVIPLNGAD